MRRLAIIGSGVAGLGCAWFLRRDFDVTVFEADGRAGGHSNTIEVRGEGGTAVMDTGFMVFNKVTYPSLVRLFDRLRIPVRPTDMSFSVRHGPRGIEFCGSSLNRLFAQRRNLLRPSFYRMLGSIDRFNREAPAALADPAAAGLTLEEYVRRRGYGDDFLNLYLIPMASAVWSAPADRMLRFPAATLLRFFHNHGFLGLHTQHPWWTVEGGSRTYVGRITSLLPGRVRLGTPVRRLRRVAGGIELEAGGENLRFDAAILACHPPESLGILGDGATPAERRQLGPFRYQPNVATVHTDESVMPRARLAWSSWNHRIDAGQGDSGPFRASTHYWMNSLQGVPGRVNYFVSINGGHLADPARVLRTIRYEHPLLDLAAVGAQEGIPALNAAARGRTETYFAGAWQRYGFHEDGLLSAADLAGLILGRDPWPAPGEEAA